MKQLFIFATTLLFLGCGSGTDSADNAAGQEETVVMTSSETYQVNPGDHINKLTEDTQLVITHNQGEEGSSIELLQGSAEIVRRI